MSSELKFNSPFNCSFESMHATSQADFFDGGEEHVTSIVSSGGGTEEKAAAAARRSRSSRSASRSSVRFAPSLVSVRPTLGLWELTPREVETTWITDEDEARSQNDAVDTVRAMRRAAAADADGDDDDELKLLCTRGLEHMRSVHDVKAKEANKRRVIDAVLEEQERQALRDLHDSAGLCAASERGSRGAREGAVGRAKVDAACARVRARAEGDRRGGVETRMNSKADGSHEVPPLRGKSVGIGVSVGDEDCPPPTERSRSGGKLLERKIGTTCSSTRAPPSDRPGLHACKRRSPSRKFPLLEKHASAIFTELNGLIDAVGDGGSSNNGSTEPSSWTCSACTLVHAGEEKRIFLACELCGATREESTTRQAATCSIEECEIITTTTTRGRESERSISNPCATNPHEPPPSDRPGLHPRGRIVRQSGARWTTALPRQFSLEKI